MKTKPKTTRKPTQPIDLRTLARDPVEFDRLVRLYARLRAEQQGNDAPSLQLAARWLRRLIGLQLSDAKQTITSEAVCTDTSATADERSFNVWRATAPRELAFNHNELAYRDAIAKRAKQEAEAVARCKRDAKAAADAKAARTVREATARRKRIERLMKTGCRSEAEAAKLVDFMDAEAAEKKAAAALPVKLAREAAEAKARQQWKADHPGALHPEDFASHLRGYQR